MRGLALLLALGGFGLLTACDDESTTTADGGGGAPPQGETYAAGMAKATDAVTVVLVEAVPGPPIRGDSNVWTLALQDAEGAPMDGCTIEVDPRMPAHGHGTTPVPVATPIEGETGMFEVRPLNLFMPGLWRVAVRPTCGSDTAEVFFEFWIES
ncbi:MAG: FixH family protein [Myxococcales bacterium]|nr:FixH family protein [Myxococcales bacterium]